MKKLIFNRKKRQLRKSLEQNPQDFVGVPVTLQMQIAEGDVILTEKESQKETAKLRKQVEKFAGYKPQKNDLEK